MIDTLEAELRATLEARARDIPPTAVARVARRDYRPRARSLRPPLAVGGAAGAAGAVVAAVSLSAGASSAFAGWTAKPTPPAPLQLAAAQQRCAAKSAQSPIAGLPLKLSDTRGPFTFAVYASDTSTAVCISGPSFTSMSASVSSAPSTPVADGRVTLWSEHLTRRDGQAYSFADGRTGANVKAVTLALDNGTKVDATVGGGWFVAWWPSTAAVKSALVTTPSGTSTESVPSAATRPCGTTLCRRQVLNVGGSGRGAARARSGASRGSVTTESGTSQSSGATERGSATFQSASS